MKVVTLNGLNRFLENIKSKLLPRQQVVTNQNYISDVTDNVFYILDNSAFSYPAGQTWWINLKLSNVNDNNSVKEFKFMIRTGSNTVNLGIGNYLNVSGVSQMQANSTYMITLYGYGT
jgi:hypothetical protein